MRSGIVSHLLTFSSGGFTCKRLFTLSSAADGICCCGLVGLLGDVFELELVLLSLTLLGLVMVIVELESLD